VPKKPAKVDILPISIYLVVVLYRHKHCRPQKVELDLACRDSTTTNYNNHALHQASFGKFKLDTSLELHVARIWRMGGITKRQICIMKALGSQV
jgi:hypothetical protein